LDRFDFSNDDVFTGEKQMTEVDPAERIYQGASGEPATITVTATNTKHMVTYSLNGAPAVKLPEGKVLQFPIPANLLMVLAYDNPSGTGGKYAVALKSVEGYPNKVSTRVYEQVGGTPDTKTYTFLL
jgi:hypothetical protein